jgi:hypothetical protein
MGGDHEVDFIFVIRRLLAMLGAAVDPVRLSLASLSRAVGLAFG